MNIFRKNTAAVTALITLIIAGMSIGGIIGAQNNGTLYLKDIEGDRSVLGDVVINGVLQDKYHGQSFLIKEGEISQSFKFYDEESDLVKSTQKPSGNETEIDEIQYFQTVDSEPSPDGNSDVERKPWYPNEHTTGGNSVVQLENIKYTKEITKTDKLDLYVSFNRRKTLELNETIKVNTGISLKSDKKEFEFQKIYFTNDEEKQQAEHITSESRSVRIPVYANYNNGYTFIDGKLYFTVLTDKTASGSNGIFRIDEWGSWPNWDQASNYGKVEKITGFNLDKHNIDVLGLENVGNKLVMYLLVDNILTFRAYDPDSGKMLDELRVDIAAPYGDNRNYQAFSDGNSLSVCFLGQTGIVVNVKLEDKFSLGHVVKPLDIIGRKEAAPALYNVEAVNGKLFIMTYVTDETMNNDYVFVLKKRHLLVLVYDRANPVSRLLYKGEIVSDAYEDTEYDRNNMNYSGGYTLYDYRQFDALKVESR